jgi:hypothetical protein
VSCPIWLSKSFRMSARRPVKTIGAGAGSLRGATEKRGKGYSSSRGEESSSVLWTGRRFGVVSRSVYSCPGCVPVCVREIHRKEARAQVQMTGMTFVGTNGAVERNTDECGHRFVVTLVFVFRLLEDGCHWNQRWDGSGGGAGRGALSKTMRDNRDR